MPGSSEDNAPSRRLLLGLIGYPITHSASPAIHRAAARSLGLRAHYQLVEAPDASPAALGAMLEGVRLLGFAGVNITFPYKEIVLSLLDSLSPAAKAMGAVNTVTAHGGRLVGHNTDCTGFTVGFRAVFGEMRPGRVALIGAGGVGKAIAFALADLGADELRILDHDPAKTTALIAALGERVRAVAVADPEEALAGASGLVNATPLGMLPDRSLPVPAELLHQALWVADAVYNPLWTPLLLAARERGAAVMTGRELCLHQARDAFALFAGVEPSLAPIADAFDAVMRARGQACA